LKEEEITRVKKSVRRLLTDCSSVIAEDRRLCQISYGFFYFATILSQSKVVSLVSNTQPGGPRLCMYPPSDRVARLYLRALGSLSVASYDLQGYGGGNLTHLHMFNYACLTIPFLITLFLTVFTFFDFAAMVFFSFLRWDDTESTGYVGHYLAHSTSP
jgi:hypothetical protein